MDFKLEQTREDPSPAYITRLLDFAQMKCEEAMAAGLQQPPLLFMARTDPDTNNPEFEGESKLELTAPIFLKNTKKGDLDIVGPIIKVALTTHSADVAVFISEGWVACCSSLEEVERIHSLGLENMEKTSGGKSAIVITLYTREAEYAVVNNIIVDADGTRRMERGELHWDQEFQGGMSIHTQNDDFGTTGIARTAKKNTLH